MKTVWFRAVASFLFFGGIFALVTAIMWRPVLERFLRVPRGFIWTLFVIGGIATPTGFVMCVFYGCQKYYGPERNPLRGVQRRLVPQIDVELQNALNTSLQETTHSPPTVLDYQTTDINGRLSRTPSRSINRSPSPRIMLTTDSQHVDYAETALLSPEPQQLNVTETVFLPPPYEERPEGTPPPSYEDIPPIADEELERQATPPPSYEEIMHEV